MHMMWNFFALGHKKGEHNGASVVIKRTLTHEELKPDGVSMKGAADVVKFLKAKFGDTAQSHRSNTQKVFWLVPKDEVQWDI